MSVSPLEQDNSNEVGDDPSQSGGGGEDKKVLGERRDGRGERREKEAF